MIIVPNHHVIVPRTEDAYIEINTVATNPQTRRQAHVQRMTLTNADTVQLNFQPLSDQWIELYLDGYRIINPKYATHRTPGARYENYNLVENNQIRFSEPQTGNLKIICDTLTHTLAEGLIDGNIAGAVIGFENIQSYDVFEKRFNPSRYPMPDLGLVNTVIRIRVGDAHYCEPIVLAQPCYGYVRVSKDRKSLVYVPRISFSGYDVFGYTLMSQRGQMGMPASITVKVGTSELDYNWSANLATRGSFVSIRDHKHPYIAELAGKLTTLEFYFYTKSVDTDKNFRVGIYGQYRDRPVDGRFAIYLQGTGSQSGQVVVVQYSISSFDILGNPVFNIYKLSSKVQLAQRRWHHVVVQIDAITASSATVSMYIDGERETFRNNDFTGHTTWSGDHYLIGAVNDRDASQTFVGYISNFRVMSGLLPYTGEIIQVPRRPLANIAQVQLLGFVNKIQSRESIQDMSDITRLQKLGNITMEARGPFSPTLTASSATQVMHGETFRIGTTVDVLCADTIVPWAVNSNASISAINQVHWSSNAPNLSIASINQQEAVISTTYLNQGFFQVDDIEAVEITVDTHTELMTSRRRIEFYLEDYPLVKESIDILADPDGLVLSIQATNDGFARDSINFNHGSLVSLGAYNNSLGGYFDFNGTTDVITGLNSKIINILGNVTAIIWFRIRNTAADPVRLFGKGSDADYSYAVFYNTTTDQFIYRRRQTTGDIETIYQNTGTIVGNWYQIAVSTDSYRHRVYLNGSLVAETFLDLDSVTTNTAGYSIGYGGVGSYHDGQVSQVQLWNRALTTTEIAANFNQYRSRYGL